MKMYLGFCAAAFVASFFLPAVDGTGAAGAKSVLELQRRMGSSGSQSPIGSITGKENQDTMTGLDAADLVFSALSEAMDSGKETKFKDLARVVWWNVANSAFVVAIVLGLIGFRKLPAFLSILGILSAGYWILSDDLSELGLTLGVGYWVWVGAMAFAALAYFGGTMFRAPSSSSSMPRASAGT